MPNFRETGPVIADIAIFFIFHDGSHRLLGFSKMGNFIGRQCPEGPDASLY